MSEAWRRARKKGTKANQVSGQAALKNDGRVISMADTAVRRQAVTSFGGAWSCGG